MSEGRDLAGAVHGGGQVLQRVRVQVVEVRRPAWQEVIHYWLPAIQKGTKRNNSNDNDK
jgi:hypothetical protein